MSEKRQVTDEEKSEILRVHGRRCFVDGEPFEEGETIEFHHIRPFGNGGPSTPENVAPVCRTHHLNIGLMSLQEFRDKLSLRKYFLDDNSDKRLLDDLIRIRRGHDPVVCKHEINDGKITLYFKQGPQTFNLSKCPSTGWEYFYASLPVDYLFSDRKLQPRDLRFESLWRLYQHFLTNTQLAPSICRIAEGGKILLFDGQHKAAAQVWANRPTVECKVYLNTDPEKLEQINIDAHGTYRQMSFYSHELMRKYAAISIDDWEDYMQTSGAKSEKGFHSFLILNKKKTRSQATNEITQAIYNEILNDPGNMLSNYVAEKHRGRNQPLTIARLQKTFFREMILPPPVEDEFESEEDCRVKEKRNLLRLMTIIAEESLEGKWAPERSDSNHLKAERIFSAGAVRTWVILLKNTINQHLRHYTDEQRKRFFYSEIEDAEFEYFRTFVRRIFEHKLWSDPDPTGEIAARLAKDDVHTTQALFDERGLTVPKILGG